MIARWWRSAKSLGDRLEVAILTGIVGAMIVLFFFLLGAVLRAPN